MQVGQPTIEQVAFETLIRTAREMAPTSRLYSYALNIFEQFNFSNTRMTNMLEAVIKLYVFRSKVQTQMTPQVLLQSICRQVICGLAANLASVDVNFMNQLNVIERAQVLADKALTVAIDAEISAYEEAVASPDFQRQSQQTSGMGPRTSSRFSHRKDVPVAPVPMPENKTTQVVDNALAPGRWRGRAVAPTQEIKEAPKMNQQKAPAAAATPKQEIKRITAVAFNPNTQCALESGTIIPKEEKMDYAKHQAVIASQITKQSTSRENTDALNIIAAGVAFNPLDLEVPAEILENLELKDKFIEDKLNEAMMKIVHSAEPIFAMGPAHAELQFLHQAQSKGIDTRRVPHSYDYRDVQIHHVLDPRSNMADAIFPTFDVVGLESLQDLRDFIVTMTNSGNVVDGDMAITINNDATSTVNEFLFFYCQSTVEISDFAADLDELVAYLENKYPAIHQMLVQHNHTVTERITGSVFKDFDAEQAKLLNKWASISSPTLRGRAYGLSHWRACMSLPINAYELGLEIAPAYANTLSAKWAFISEADAPLFYNLSHDLYKRLAGDTFTYRSVSIFTLDGFEYQIRDTTRTTQTGEPLLGVRLMPRN